MFHDALNPSMPFSTLTLFRSRLTMPSLFAATAAALLTLTAHAQTPEAAPPAPAPAASSSAPPATASAAPAPARYTASNLALAFNFMDANHDGRISREEAASFSGVAKHFDEADTNHDNALSREEFDYAMNYVKPN